MSCISGCSECILWDLNRWYWAVPHTLTFFLIASHKLVLAYFCSERHKKYCLDSHWVCSTMNSTCQNFCPHLISLLYHSFPDSMIEMPVLNFPNWAPKHQLLPHRLQTSRLLSAPSFKIHTWAHVDQLLKLFLLKIFVQCSVLQSALWYLCLSRRPFPPSKLNFLSSRLLSF